MWLQSPGWAKKLCFELTTTLLTLKLFWRFSAYTALWWLHLCSWIGVAFWPTQCIIVCVRCALTLGRNQSQVMEHHLSCAIIRVAVAQVNMSSFYPQLNRLVLNLLTMEGWKVELIPRWFTHPQTVTHSNTGQAQHRTILLIETKCLNY